MYKWNKDGIVIKDRDLKTLFNMGIYLYPKYVYYKTHNEHMVDHVIHDVCVWHLEIVFHICCYFYTPNFSCNTLEKMLRNLITKIFIVTRHTWHLEPDTKCSQGQNWENAAETQIFLERTAAAANYIPLNIIIIVIMAAQEVWIASALPFVLYSLWWSSRPEVCSSDKWRRTASLLYVSLFYIVKILFVCLL